MIWTAKTSHYNCNPERLCNTSALIILTAFAMRHLLFLFEGSVVSSKTQNHKLCTLVQIVHFSSVPHKLE
jgi:hypothetical protein